VRFVLKMLKKTKKAWILKTIILISFSLNFGCTTISKEYSNRRHEINEFCSIVKQDLPKQMETPTSKTMCLMAGYRLQKEKEEYLIASGVLLLAIAYLVALSTNYAMEE